MFCKMIKLDGTEQAVNIRSDKSGKYIAVWRIKFAEFSTMVEKISDGVYRQITDQVQESVYTRRR